MTTTKNNPGAFNRQSKITLRKIGSKTLSRIALNEYRAIVNGFISDFSNIINQERRKNYYYCNLCDQKSPYFIHISNRYMIKWHSACPFCNSRKRHRGLKILYERLLVSLDKPKIIHFAPEPVYYPIFKNKKYIYKTTDFFLEDVDYPHEDIQNLSIKDGMFDLALCNHVLEHVKNDKQAIKEVVRILDTGGQAIFTIPGNWRRKKTIKLPDLSYNGHYRDYGLEIIKVFEELFQSVEVLDLYEFNNYYKLPMGLTKKEDLAFICKK